MIKNPRVRLSHNICLLSSTDSFFSKLTFLKNLSVLNTVRVSNGLDPDQDRHSVGPDLGQTVCKDCQHRTSYGLSYDCYR